MSQSLLKYLLSVLLVVLVFNSFAQTKQEPLSLTALTDPVLAIAKNGIGLMRYKLTNHSNKTYHVTMKSIPGIIQESSDEHACEPGLISLKPQQSCQLNLQVIPNRLLQPNKIPNANPISPQLCEEPINSHQSSPVCIEPQPQEQIKIRTLTAEQAAISVKVELPLPQEAKGLIAESLGRCFSSFDLCTLTLFQSSGVTGNLVITNTSSTVTILNLMAYNLPSGVTQDASGCTSIAPGATCTLLFTPGDITNLGATISIYGSNTPISYVTVQVLGVGDLYNGAQLFQLPSTTSPTVYTAAASDNFAGQPSIWTDAINACTNHSTIPTLQQLQQLYSASNCNNGPISGFTCMAANTTFYWSSDTVNNLVQVIDFADGSPEALPPDFPSYSRCVTGYNLVYSLTQ